jgi:hypothetical protein
MILVDHQRSFRQICLSSYIETASSLAFVGMTGAKAVRWHCSSCAWNRYAITHAGTRLAKFSVIHSNGGHPPLALRASAGRGPGSREPSRRASRPSGFDPSRGHESLAFGSRRHFIPASLSLPLCGCLLNRSRDCSRSRVPPRFSRPRYADAPAAASFFCLRFAPARFRQSPVGKRNRKPDPA